MDIHLSREHIDLFAGNVLPLRLVSDHDLSGIKVVWRTDSDCVAIRAFDQEQEFPFSSGVLLTLMKPGQARVCAEADGKAYICRVDVREMRRASSSDTLQYFVGDFHDHTTSEHGHDAFAARESSFPCDVIRQIRDENKLAFHVISDHAITLNPRDFYRGFTDSEAACDGDPIVFPGAESEIQFVEYDRYGYEHKNSGEIVTVNAAEYAFATTWEEFYSKMARSPFAVCALAHPQIVGYSVPGIWNFSLDRNNTERFLNMVRLVEMGNGTDRESNLLNEYTYSVALDNGFKVTTACSSDCHGPVWGYGVFPGKTVVMAYEHSREAFLDALTSCRAYACESGNLKLSYTVNGIPAPASLEPAAQYRFRVDVSCFHDDPSSLPVSCQVISDKGLTVHQIEGTPLTSFGFTVKSDTAHYFYLRLVDSMGRKTWSMPVWTGRPIRPVQESACVPISKEGFVAKDELTGRDASALICDDPSVIWTAEGETASILIDMQTDQPVCGVGHYAVPVIRTIMKQLNVPTQQLLASFVSGYRISVSTDGRTFEPCAEGLLRVFGGEEVIRFPVRTARFIRFEALSTVGKNSGLPQYAGARPIIGELTAFTEA